MHKASATSKIDQNIKLSKRASESVAYHVEAGGGPGG